MILELNLKNKIISLLLLICYPFVVLADPEVNEALIPPGEAMYVTDPSILNSLNLGPDTEPVWCYSNLANSLIITSAEREREKCRLQMAQEITRIKINHTFEIDQLKISLDSMKDRHEKIVYLKNKQIEDLTNAALVRPNDYSIWWATGGVITGVLTTLSIMFAVK